MTTVSKIEVKNVFKIFGARSKDALAMVSQGPTIFGRRFWIDCSANAIVRAPGSVLLPTTANVAGTESDSHDDTRNDATIAAGTDRVVRKTA